MILKEFFPASGRGTFLILMAALLQRCLKIELARLKIFPSAVLLKLSFKISPYSVAFQH